MDADLQQDIQSLIDRASKDMRTAGIALAAKERINELEKSDAMFRRVIEILVEQNGGTTPDWLINLA